MVLPLEVLPLVHILTVLVAGAIGFYLMQKVCAVEAAPRRASFRSKCKHPSACQFTMRTALDLAARARRRAA